MTTKAPKRVRCAVYTRVSTEYGLDQEFNSLDAQHEAAEAYIRSQAHDGWTPLRARYDDGGYSGGSTDRPALQQLLEDIRAGKIDIIVVYKVRPAHPFPGRLRQARGTVRRPCGVVRLGDPAIQYY